MNRSNFWGQFAAPYARRGSSPAQQKTGLNVLVLKQHRSMPRGTVKPSALLLMRNSRFIGDIYFPHENIDAVFRIWKQNKPQHVKKGNNRYFFCQTWRLCFDKMTKNRISLAFCDKKIYNKTIIKLVCSIFLFDYSHVCRHKFRFYLFYWLLPWRKFEWKLERTYSSNH